MSWFFDDIKEAWCYRANNAHASILAFGHTEDDVKDINTDYAEVMKEEAKEAKDAKKKQKVKVNKPASGDARIVQHREEQQKRTQEEREHVKQDFFRSMVLKHRLYTVQEKRKTKMSEGFLPISFFKYDMQRLAMREMYGTLKSAGLRIIGINTDSLYVQNGSSTLNTVLKRHADKFDMTSSYKSIGKWKVEDKLWCPEKKLRVQENTLEIDVVSVATKEVSIEEEKHWDVKGNKFVRECNKLMRKSNTYIKSDYPGCGKTYVAEQLRVSRDTAHVD